MNTAEWRIAVRAAVEAIESGACPPGETIPIAEVTGCAPELEERVRRELHADGHVALRGTDAVVRDRRRIKIPSIRNYGPILKPGGMRGPWETATFQQGYAGRMLVIAPQVIPVPDDIAPGLGLEVGALVVQRIRHAVIGEEVVQLQSVWYPLDVAEAAGLDGPGKVVGGSLGALAGAGFRPSRAEHDMYFRLPTEEECAILNIGARVPIVRTQRIVYDQTGRAVELLRIIGAADRIEFVDSDPESTAA